MGSIEFVLSIVKDRGMVHQATLFDLARTEFPGSIAYEAMVRLEEDNKVLRLFEYYVFLEDFVPMSILLTAEEFIANELSTLGVIKVTELYAKAAPYFSIAEIEKAIKNLELVEVEYVLPNMSYRTKTLYFPKGTKVNFNN